MDQKALYAFRGWIAFVAFMDLGNAVRSYIEKRSYLGEITGLLSGWLSACERRCLTSASSRRVLDIKSSGINSLHIVYTL
ncbi:Uncharacterized protein GBIM_11916 [Gryllus bimaculatus]|nr:Uncharacterized protein GBIM_11916 [Gryllus bimaculatus]